MVVFGEKRVMTSLAKAAIVVVRRTDVSPVLGVGPEGVPERR